MNTDCKLIWESYELLTELAVSKANVQRLITKYGVDEPAARSLINRFNEVEGTLAKKDIFTYDSIEELEAAIGAVTTEREKVTKGAIKVFENDKAIVLLIRTKEASIKQGRKTKWCLSYDDSKDNLGNIIDDGEGNQFYSYTFNSYTIYFVLPKTGIEKFAILKGKDNQYGEIKDKDNKDADIQKILSSYSLPERIFQSVPYTQQEMSVFALSSPYTAYDYAVDVIQDRWPEGEHLISTHPVLALDYAREIIGDRWPEAELTIIKHPAEAVNYAIEMIGDRWPEAESTIMTNGYAAGRYASSLLNGVWPEAEALLRKDPLQYSHYVDGLGVNVMI